MKRNKGIYFLLTLVVMILGLASRRFIDVLPKVLGDYSGDVLWALMVFLGLAFLFNKRETKDIILMALVFSYGIEISQLYHAPWIDGIRGTSLGGLILGYGFLFSDLICYTVGIGIGAFIDKGNISTFKNSLKQRKNGNT